ncbi:hypothetical protein F4778DRAFT_13419 [Xylariomycetidae sp. FL2044]|nr:hypothetical protein F4778DRAFT_13419 [Xylariomycetidae sp. FL2044]
MSPSPGDEAQLPQDSKTPSGLAGVFKGLAGAAKLTKFPTNSAQSNASTNAQIAEHLYSRPIASRGLPSQYVESFDLLKNGSLSERVAAAGALRHVVSEYPLNPVLDIWYAAKDLIEPTNARSTRVAGWELLAECVKHPSSTDLERKEYFQTISAEANPEDFHLQLATLTDLTKHGRDVSGFDYDVFPILSSWLESTFESVRAARNAAKKQGSRTKGKVATNAEDRNLFELFAFIRDVIKFNFSVADDAAAEAMIGALLSICMNTSVEDDLRACISVLNAIVTFGTLPADRLKSCISVLCSIHCLVPSLQKDAWHTISILCRSHNDHATVGLLLEMLGSAPAEVNKNGGNRVTRGVLSVLLKLVSKSAEKGYPVVSYALLVDGLAKAVKSASYWRIQTEILRLTNSLLCDAQGNVNHILIDEDWTSLFDVALTCSEPITSSTKFGEPLDLLLTRVQPETAEGMVANELSNLINRLEILLNEPHRTLPQRHDCILFFTKMHHVLPDSVARLVLDYFQEFRCCFPSDTEWKANLDLVIDALFANRLRSSDIRLRALRVITEVYDMVELLSEQFDLDFVPRLAKRLLNGVSNETDISVLQELVSFVSTVATTTSFDLFCHITNTLRSIVDKHRLRSPISHSLPHGGITPTSPENTRTARDQVPANVVTRAYVAIFLRVMNDDIGKAAKLFELLVSIAKSSSSEPDARITAMQLLFRLRADWANRIFVTVHTESSSLASTIHRTEASLARKIAQDANRHSHFTASSRSSRGASITQASAQDRIYPIRSASGPTTSLSFYQQLWNSSDLEILPEVPSKTASLVLLSGLPEKNPDSDDPVQMDSILSTRLWLEAVIFLLKSGCEWEVYSFILVHLPSQLSNHALFVNAVPQVQELRRTICDLITKSSFPEPPTGLFRADVAILLFHTLTIIISYHQHFQKAEEDEIVRTLVHGINTWERSAKCCIHALTICCHELPLSISKVLVAILSKLSSIITQQNIAMHVLEFLACLSRLPSLYSNFREDEYRIVFGISFRYLQTVRGNKQSLRVSLASDTSTPVATTPGGSERASNPIASDDLPQYVYALAYQVILFWFLALKLQDRPNHVGWIAKNLFMDVDGSQVSDEQAQIMMDFMQRVAYADVDESAADPLFTAGRYGAILKKRWIIGHSIVTIEQATATGWAQITKRQPSATSCYMIRDNFRPPPAHQRPTNDFSADMQSSGANHVLPSHLLVQLLSSMPQNSDLARPIPLPDDEAVNRAIRVFDRNSTVDGYKVGVIYIGENQTDESEILANISGSRDYVEFLNGLGTLTRLKDATFNTQGLDRAYDSDGQYTFCWRDRVTEMVFHVTTQMPTNLDHDPHCTLKKRHIGNDFVNVIFNDSGLPFQFDTFPSEFNFVNIVITAESRASFVATRQRAPKDIKDTFYKVQVMSKPGFPEISSASESKLVSLKALPDFIRLLALNASVFSLVWANRAGGEHVSPWRNRLREINRLRDKYGVKVAAHGPSPSPPGTSASYGSAGPNASAMQLEAARANTVRDSFSSFRRSSVATFFTNSSEHNNSHRSSMLSTATTDNTEVMTTTSLDSLVDSVDFSRWA